MAGKNDLTSPNKATSEPYIPNEIRDFMRGYLGDNFKAMQGMLASIFAPNQNPQGQANSNPNNPQQAALTQGNQAPRSPNTIDTGFGLMRVRPDGSLAQVINASARQSNRDQTPSARFGNQLPGNIEGVGPTPKDIWNNFFHPEAPQQNQPAGSPPNGPSNNNGTMQVAKPDNSPRGQWNSMFADLNSNPPVAPQSAPAIQPPPSQYVKAADPSQGANSRLAASSPPPPPGAFAPIRLQLPNNNLVPPDIMPRSPTE